MATQALTISRRAALLSCALIPTLPLMAVASIETDHITALSRRLEISHADVTSTEYEAPEFDALFARYSDCLNEIADIPAGSPASLKLKARALALIYGADPLLADAGDSTDVRLARQIINGLLTLPVAA